MKKILCLLNVAVYLFCQEELTYEREPIEPLHSNIHIQKISNESDLPTFVAFERAHIMPLDEPIELTGHIMSGNSLEIADPEGIIHAVMIPVWQKTFRGNTINVVSLASKIPGRIYYLYVINDNLWAINAPNREGELQGVHLLGPSEQDRKIELIIKNNNILEVTVLDSLENQEETQLNTSEDS